MQSSGSNKSAFTLIELLVVIAIIAILAAILFPVFAQAKAAALKTVDISNFKQVGTATQLYLGDNDGRYFFSNSGGNPTGWGYGPPDTVPGMAMAPYVKNTKIHVCPIDPWQSEDQRIRDHAPLNGWNVNTMTATQKLYALMVRSNMGYNYQFFSPWRLLRNPTNPTSAVISESEITNVSATIAFANAIWDRDPRSGNPIGGGNWVIETPCWEDENNRPLRPFNQYMAPPNGDGTLWSYAQGWSNSGNSWLVYGGMWPFHNQVAVPGSPGLKYGQVVVMMADSSVKSRQLKSLTQGCTAYGTGARKGNRIAGEDFLWDLD
jgi:prepilin-type N-terminal cleavage/methylation domain-containing protein